MTLANNSVFISYRKDDSGGWAAQLAADLRVIVGEGAVFIDDSTSIPYGSQWPEEISIALDQCRVFLPVIAPSWSQEPNLGRLKEPDDWVRSELITIHARQSSVLCIPVFINEAPIFDPNQFSEDVELHVAIDSLMKQQGLILDRSPEHWTDKIDSLMFRIRGHLGVEIPHGDWAANAKREAALLTQIRNDMLLASSTELTRLLYEIENFLAKSPHSVEARLLHDDIKRAIERTPDIPIRAEPPAFSGRRKTSRNSLFIALAIATIAAAYFYYFHIL